MTHGCQIHTTPDYVLVLAFVVINYINRIKNWMIGLKVFGFDIEHGERIPTSCQASFKP